MAVFPFVSWKFVNEKVYQYLRSFYTGKSELAANYLARIQSDYQLTDFSTGQRVRIVKDSKGFPNGVCFVDALIQMRDQSVKYER